MSQFPTQFSESKTFVTTKALNVKGFYIDAGLANSDIPEIAEIGRSESVREFCPNDSDTRFGSVEAAEKWLSKGRGMFLLRQNGTGKLAGYGWTGPETSPHIPDGETTFAVRLSPDFTGKGLATPFTHGILLGSVMLFGCRNIWLETWKSNEAAVRTYTNNGAVLAHSAPAERATQSNSEGTIPDVRLFMHFVQTFKQ